MKLTPNKLELSLGCIDSLTGNSNIICDCRTLKAQCWQCEEILIRKGG